MHTRPRSTGDATQAITRATHLATASLQQGRCAVQTLPRLVNPEELRVALLGLSAWFERVCTEGDYVSTAPADGIEALHQIAHDVTVARWAVRVAEDVVQCRLLLRPKDTLGDIDLDVVFAQLELAMHRRGQKRSDKFGSDGDMPRGDLKCP